MDTSGSRKSSSRAVTTDRNFSHGLREGFSLSLSGNRQVQIQKKLPKLASDSISQSSDTTDDDLVLCELGWSSSKKAVGTPMKNLLAKEMSREAESKRRSPNVIVRLMGLDGLPPQQPSHKQQKMASGNSFQRLASTKKAKKNSTSYSCQSSRKSSKEEQEFKDVFEVLDASKMEGKRYLPQGPGNSKVLDSEMAFIQQKFMNAKRLSTDEKLQNSKEFHDTIDDLDSNKDLLLKLLEQPDSLFTKHLHDLQGISSHCHCSRISATESSNAPGLACGCSGYKTESETPRKSPRKPHHDFCSPQSKHAAHDSPKSAKIQLAGKDESNNLPTRIVVLKPNLGKVQKTTRTVTSPHSSLDLPSDCSKHSRVSRIRSRELELGAKNKFPDDLVPPRYKSRESREVAKEIAREMRNTFRSGSTKFIGYSGDESSSNRSENDSAVETEVTSVSSRNSVDSCHQCRPSSRTTESYVTSEARKRLSERWKLAHRSVDMGEVSRSSTLREMLTIPDREVRSPKSDVVSSGKGSSHKIESSNGPAGCAEPLGISSRDGWKEGCIGTLSRSRSLPVSSTDTGSFKMVKCQETACDKKCGMPHELMQRERCRMVNGISPWREGASLRSSKFHKRAKRSHVSSCISSDGEDSQEQVLSNGMQDISVKQNYAISETSASTVTDTALVPEFMVDTDAENMTMPPKPMDPELPSTFAKGKSAPSIPNVSSPQDPLSVPPEEGSVPMQNTVVEPESTASSKESDQPSPVSVLETPFLDDLSSGSECFESLSADLQGLRVQLELLKLESEQFADRPMIVSSDEEAEEMFVSFSEGRGLGEQSREFSYLVDLLQDSGLTDADPDTFVTTWHSLESPVNPLVFEELEKIYIGDPSWTRTDRKLLFDRVNTVLLAIYQQVVNPHPWRKPAGGIALRWTRNGLEDRLCKMLASKDNKGNRDAAETVLARQSQWLDLANDIDEIGSEIERMLTEELVEELVSA